MLELVRGWIISWRRTPRPEVNADLVNAIEELANEAEKVVADLNTSIASLRALLRSETEAAVAHVRTMTDANRERIEQQEAKVGRIEDPEASPTVFPGTFDPPGRKR